MPQDENGHQAHFETIQMEAAPRLPRTLERRAFVEGLFAELTDQLSHYLELVGQQANLTARLTIAERNLKLTRDHLQAMMASTHEELPDDWRSVFRQVRFISVRLGDACIEVLKEQGPLTTEELVGHLNAGQFRFRTGTPLREVHAALLKQQVKKHKDHWRYVGPKAQAEEVVA